MYGRPEAKKTAKAAVVPVDPSWYLIAALPATFAGGARALPDRWVSLHLRCAGMPAETVLRVPPTVTVDYVKERIAVQHGGAVQHIELYRDLVPRGDRIDERSVIRGEPGLTVREAWRLDYDAEHQAGSSTNSGHDAMGESDREGSAFHVMIAQPSMSVAASGGGLGGFGANAHASERLLGATTTAASQFGAGLGALQMDGTASNAATAILSQSIFGRSGVGGGLGATMTGNALQAGGGARSVGASLGATSRLNASGVPSALHASHGGGGVVGPGGFPTGALCVAHVSPVKRPPSASVERSPASTIHPEDDHVIVYYTFGPHDFPSPLLFA
jgi:hypothetical protein